MSGTQKVTFTLPEAVVERLSVVSYQLGVSRSALVASLIFQSLADIERAFDKGLSLTGGVESGALTPRRLRGRLVADLRDFVALARLVDSGAVCSDSVREPGPVHAE